MYITKYVHGSELHVGMDVKGYKQNESDIPTSFLGKVEEVSETTVKIKRFNRFVNEYNVNGLFKVAMSDDEIIDRYMDEVYDAHVALRNRIPLSECGVYVDVVPFAFSVVFKSVYALVDFLEKDSIRLVGVCDIDDHDDADKDDIYICYLDANNTRCYSKVRKSVVQAYLEDVK